LDLAEQKLELFDKVVGKVARLQGLHQLEEKLEHSGIELLTP
jgi:spermidine synthase